MCFALALCGCALAQTVPKLLIVQPKRTEKGGLPPGFDVLPLLADDLDSNGQVVPIAYSLTDPAFRQAMATGKVKMFDSGPTLDEAFNAERAVGARYLLVAETELEGQVVRGRVKLYEGSHLIWRDPEKTNQSLVDSARRMLDKKLIDKSGFDQVVASADKRVMTVSGDQGLDIDSTAMSLARTWAELISLGPLKSLPTHPKTASPEPLRGQQPKLADPDVPPVAKPLDDAELMKNLATLQAAGETAAGLNLLRDAVDQAPFDVDRRTALVEALISAGKSDLAADEAKRGAALAPDKPALHVLAARAYLAAGKPDQAQDEANLAIAHAPDTPGIHRILAEMNLQLLKFPDAIAEYDKAIEDSPTPELRFARSVAKALSGDSSGCTADLDAAQKQGLKVDDASVRTRYLSTIDLVSLSIRDSAKQIPALLQQASLKRSSPDIKADIAKQAQIGVSRLAFLTDLPHPAEFDVSHRRRALALNLLNQCIAQVQEYLGSGSDDTLTEARINLGEALKQIDAADSALKDEKQKSNGSEPS